jgi:7-cyano-7-deazaguanine reductase
MRYMILFITKLNQKKLKVIADFNPRGNVHTIIEIDSEMINKG